jgi:predicted transcriptional regulator
MKRERNSENPTRERLEQYISENPGISFNFIMSAFRMNAGTLRYHLEYLEGAHRIKMVKKGNNRCYFPDYMATYISAGSNGRELSTIEKRIASIIDGNPGITRKGILSSMDIRKEELTRVIHKLREKNVICRSENDAGFETLTRERILGEVMAILIEKLLDNEIDFDTFRAIKNRLET